MLPCAQCRQYLCLELVLHGENEVLGKRQDLGRGLCRTAPRHAVREQRTGLARAARSQRTRSFSTACFSHSMSSLSMSSTPSSSIVTVAGRARVGVPVAVAWRENWSPPPTPVARECRVPCPQFCAACAMDLPQLHADLLSESARLRPLLVPPPLCVVLDAEAARAKQPAGPTSAHASQPPSPGQQPLHHDHEDISSSSHSSDGEDDGGDPFARIMALTTTAASGASACARASVSQLRTLTDTCRAATEQSEQPRKRRSARRREKDQQYWERRTRMRQAVRAACCALRPRVRQHR